MAEFIFVAQSTKMKRWDNFVGQRGMFFPGKRPVPGKRLQATKLLTPQFFSVKVDRLSSICTKGEPDPWLPIDPNPESPPMAKKVLIVEDEKLIGLMLAENVRELGCHVSQVVTNGRAAVHAVRNERPDAILMDISLAGSMDGIETAQVIKSIQDIPILFFTGYQDQQLLARASSVKPFGIVDKLDTNEAILAAIGSLLR
jgi:CheY-like chemotaxis protein